MTKLDSIKQSLQIAKPYFTDTSLTTKYLYLRRMALRLFGKRVPRALWIGVTYNCQCECVYCFLGSKLNNVESTQLTFHEICDQIDAVRKMGFVEICFFGGEPLLRSEIIDLVRFSSKRGLLTGIFTNGIAINRKMAGELKKAGLSFCNVSLDSASQDMHDSLRKYKGGFRETVEGIKHLQEVGIKCTIFTYVSKYYAMDPELKELRKLIEFGRELKVKGVFLLFPMSTNHTKYDNENILTYDEKERVRTLFDPSFVGMEFPTEMAQCGGGKKYVYISPEGLVSPCPAISNYYGNIRQESLKTILEKLNIGLAGSETKVCGECAINANFHLNQSEKEAYTK